MSALQASEPQSIEWPEAEGSRALYRDARGNLRQNPVHLARAAERVAFDGSLGADSDRPLEEAPATLNPAEAGLRVQARSRLCKELEMLSIQDPGRDQALVAQEQARGAREASLQAAGAARGLLTLEKRTELATAALGTTQGRRELLAGISACIQSRLARAGLPATARAWIPGRPVTVVASRPFVVNLYSPASANPSYSPAEAAVASLSGHLLRQVRQAEGCAADLFLEVCTIDDYGERSFGWAARLVVDARQALPAPDPVGDEPVAEPPSPGVPRFRVFVVQGPHPVRVRVPHNPALRHPGGEARTLWSGMVTDEEAKALRADVGQLATLSEVEFEEVAMPEPQAPPDPRSYDLDD